MFASSLFDFIPNVMLFSQKEQEIMAVLLSPFRRGYSPGI